MLMQLLWLLLVVIQANKTLCCSLTEEYFYDTEK